MGFIFRLITIFFVSRLLFGLVRWVLQLQKPRPASRGAVSPGAKKNREVLAEDIVDAEFEDIPDDSSASDSAADDSTSNDSTADGSAAQK